MKYKVGDKVRVRKDLEIGERYYMEDASDHDSFVEGMDDLRGKIVAIKSCNGTYRIEERHFNWVDEMFEGLSNQKIVITADGKETLARLYEDGKVVKTASAKCSPSDEFDFKTGARIAFNRLVGEPVKSDEPKIEYKFEVGKYYKHSEHVDNPITGRIIGDGVIKITAIKGDTIDYEIIEGMSGDMDYHSFDEHSYFASNLTPVDDYKETEQPKNAPKIEIGKKYKLKDYKDVKDHLGITREAWNIILKDAVIPKKKSQSGTYFCKCVLGATFIIDPEAFAGEWVEPKFVPHLVMLGVGYLNYGMLGYPTRYKDAVGQALVVGDTVTLFKDGEDHGEHAIVRYNGKTFVMGIECDCDDMIGEIKDGWKIVKKRSYKDVGDGEEVSYVRYKKSAK